MSRQWRPREINESEKPVSGRYPDASSFAFASEPDDAIHGLAGDLRLTLRKCPLLPSR
jgi:hypothetical protein